MKRDSFSGDHPAVNFIYFLGVLCFGVVILHPAYLLLGLMGALSYYLLLHGVAGLRRIVLMMPLLAAVALLNPLINGNGATVLFTVFGRNYTLEALIYGLVLAMMFLGMTLWFGCYSAVMTGDKFTSLLGNLLPSLSLLLVMIFRMIPDLIGKGRQISGVRRSIGKGSDATEAAAVLSCLTGLALEGSVVTADSMRARGYGSARRTSFQRYRMTGRDKILLALILTGIAALLYAQFAGAMTASFTPQWYLAPIRPATLLLYGLYTFLPTLLHLQEAISWHISRSRI